LTGAIAQTEDVFFLTREEALAALNATDPKLIHEVARRRMARDEQARLVPPLLIGQVNPMLKKMWDGIPRVMGAVSSDTALVSGGPASPGRVTGLVRVIRGPREFDDLRSGEILVAPVTTPAWTPLFAHAAAVVTDGGSAAAHASVIAREYGIPAVVGCGDATARLRTGMRVTVDGGTGNVEPAWPLAPRMQKRPATMAGRSLKSAESAGRGVGVRRVRIVLRTVFPVRRVVGGPAGVLRGGCRRARARIGRWRSCKYARRTADRQYRAERECQHPRPDTRLARRVLGRRGGRAILVHIHVHYLLSVASSGGD
jgi:phosphohistidine swiveling domain-containing protein